MRTSLLAALALLGVVGCTTVPSERALKEAHYGDPPAAVPRDDIRRAFATLLIDPGSAQYRFGDPEQGWGRDETGFVYGWVVWTEVNSKNQFGAFTGWKSYKVLTVGGQLHSIYEPAGDDMFGNPKLRRLK